ncbi:hypothetical protein K9M06_00805 [Candidatus Bipolaricaulota bacterium]|nr:hypothetical protein [Candidatus Bipolaricaulota bacterium]
MIKNREYRAFQIFVLLFVTLFAFTHFAFSENLIVTPLLDTPDNRTYYNHLLESVKSAKKTVKVMMATADYYPDYPEGIQNDLYDALVKADSRGVKVRLILDKSSWSESITKTNTRTAVYLRNRGLNVKFDDEKVTTHTKIIIIDGRIVFLGSSNWNFPTYTETYQANVKLTNREVASFYESFFDSVWKEKKFEAIKAPPYPEEKAVIPILSSGDDRTYYRFAKKLISSAEESIDLVIFKLKRYPSFKDSKSNILIKELVKAKNRGVSVRIILDVNDWSEEINQSNRETPLWLLGQGVRKVGFDSRGSTTHSKVLLVDEETVMLGSTNWSYYSLDKNVEADLLIKDSPEVAQAFEVYFEKLWSKAEIPSREELSGGS